MKVHAWFENNKNKTEIVFNTAALIEGGYGQMVIIGKSLMLSLIHILSRHIIRSRTDTAKIGIRSQCCASQHLAFDGK